MAVSLDQTDFTLWLYAVHPAAYLRLAGDVDSDARSALSRATARLCCWAPERLQIDLADVTFACSTLINFIARVVQALPSASTVMLCRPTAQTSQLLRLTRMAEIAQVRADLPASWPMASMSV